MPSQQIKPTVRRARTALALLGAALLLGVARPAAAQTYNSGSTGANGAFNPASNVTIPVSGNGIYNYTTINIPAGVTVTYASNGTSTPVTLLASGNVTIAGAINIAGGNGTTAQLPFGAGIGGPGGYNGGNGGGSTAFQTVNYNGNPGDGPGGGGPAPGSASGSTFSGGGGGGYATMGNGGDNNDFYRNGSGGYGGPFYGTTSLLQLVGGSGGGGGGTIPLHIGGGGGGGGGAIVIASSGTLTITGAINAQGGNGGLDGLGGNSGAPGGGGAGGAVRLVATTLTGTPAINVSGGLSGFAATNYSGYGTGDPNGDGGSGFARFEAYAFSAFSPNVAGRFETNLAPSSVFLVLPSFTLPPALQITSVGGTTVPASPTGDFNQAADITLPTNTANPITVMLAASNLTPGTVATVEAIPQQGGTTAATSTAFALTRGSSTASTASANVTLSTTSVNLLYAAVTLNASTMVAGLPGAGGKNDHLAKAPPLLLNGETVTKIELTATFGGKSDVIYITSSGKRYSRRQLLGARG